MCAAKQNTNEQLFKRGRLLPLLKQMQKENNGLSKKQMTEAACELNMMLNEVYGTATFYSFLSPKEKGKNVIRVCKCIPCDMQGAQAILKSIADVTGIHPGETTSDGIFSFEVVNCIGACDQAPAMLVNDDLHGNLTPGKISSILKAYR